jgi:hypothetical protein
MALPSYMDVGNGMLKGLDTGSQMMRRYIQSKNESAETPARIALQNAQASGIPSEIALRQAQAKGIPSEITLRLAQAQQAREAAHHQSTILPALMQEYADKHGTAEAENFYNNFINKRMMEGYNRSHLGHEEYAPGQEHVPPTAPTYSGANVSPSIPDASSGSHDINNSELNSLSDNKTPSFADNVGNQVASNTNANNQNPLSYPQIASTALNGISTPALNNIAGTTGINIAKQNPIAPQNNNAIPNQPPKINDTLANGEILVKRGDPNAAYLDEMAKLPLRKGQQSPIKVSGEVNGFKTITYPSGTITKIKTGPSFEEKENTKADIAEKKQNRGEQLAEQKLDKKNNIVVAQKAYDGGKDILNSTFYYTKLLKNLDEHPALTGIGSGLTSTFHMSNDPNVADFKENTVRAQGALAKYLASRPGAMVLGIAKTGKADIYNQPDYNRGMIISGLENNKNFYDNEKAAYEQAKGLPYPIKEPEIFKQLDTLKAQLESKNNTQTPTAKVKKDTDIVNLHDSKTNTTKKMTRKEAQALISPQS